MAVTMNYDEAHAVLILHVVGVLTIDDIRTVGAALLGSRQFSPAVDTLWELDEMDFNEATYELAVQIIAYRKSILAKREQARMALVTSYTLATPVLKLYKAMSKELGQCIELFARRQDALKWLSGNR